ncbi:hypothetical protein B296_00011670 [Ensete ventricosum]|uniref:Uncharacterized protein n=1 Tax=Ensete ventricosum TaxID=4639 RepID=A0A427A9L4_ENSVE|nr:hypothetical protein B296_00011670 [Ensete ventricosum]
MLWENRCFGRIVTCKNTSRQRMLKSKVLRFDLYRLIRVVHIGPTGYRYVDRPLPSSTIKIDVSPHENETTPH